MSQELRSRLGITREEELAMPISDWVDALQPNIKNILVDYSEAEQGRWRANPGITSLINNYVQGLIGNVRRAPPGTIQKVVKSEPEPEPERSSSPISDDVIPLFGGDDDW